MVLILAGGLELDETLFELRRSGQPVALEPQAFDVLVHLVHHRNRVVAKEELMDVVWGGRFVSETAVTSRIKQVRRALGDDGRAQQVIRTVHGRGYRFLGTVEQGVASPPVTEPADRPPVRYTVTDGLHVAYQVTGGGERDIVLISGFVSHLDLDWDDPRHAHFLDRLGKMGRLIRFDKRGTGMSDRPVGAPDLETRMHDILAVMDAVGSERAVLCGYSEGVPMALLMAALHPERVAGLALYGGYARRTRAPDYPWAKSDEAREAYTAALVASWDWQADLLFRCPSGDEAMQRWWARRMGAAATPTTVRALMDMNSKVDVRDILPTISAPTLVLHRTGDELFLHQESTYIADRVPGAILRLLEGRDHLPWANADQILDVIEPFVASLPDAEHHRVLVAVLAVDGPDGGQARQRLADLGGRPRTTSAGDRVLLFDGPARAVRAAAEAAPGQAVGLAIDEVVVDGPVDGPGVFDAVRLARLAGPGSILVSPAAGVLLATSGVTLETAAESSARRVLAP